MKNGKRHMLIMVLCCAIPLLAIGAITLFKIPASRVLTTALFLLCPLSHILMMKFMGRSDHEHASGQLTEAHHGEGMLHPEIRAENAD